VLVCVGDMVVQLDGKNVWFIYYVLLNPSTVYFWSVLLHYVSSLRGKTAGVSSSYTCLVYITKYICNGLVLCWLKLFLRGNSGTNADEGNNNESKSLRCSPCHTTFLMQRRRGLHCLDSPAATCYCVFWFFSRVSSNCEDYHVEVEESVSCH